VKGRKRELQEEVRKNEIREKERRNKRANTCNFVGY
jgi:hypothetical protein